MYGSLQPIHSPQRPLAPSAPLRRNRYVARTARRTEGSAPNVVLLATVVVKSGHEDSLRLSGCAVWPFTGEHLRFIFWLWRRAAEAGHPVRPFVVDPAPCDLDEPVDAQPGDQPDPADPGTHRPDAEWLSHRRVQARSPPRARPGRLGRREACRDRGNTH